MNRDNSNLLHGWRAPRAPSDLRERALAAAHDRTRNPVRRRIEDRIWESPVARFGWLAAASMLLALNLTLDSPGRSRGLSASLESAGPATDHTGGEDVGMPIPTPVANRWTLAEAQLIAEQMLADPCLDPLTEGDCT